MQWDRCFYRDKCIQQDSCINRGICSTRSNAPGYSWKQGGIDVPLHKHTVTECSCRVQALSSEQATDCCSPGPQGAGGFGADKGGRYAS